MITWTTLSLLLLSAVTSLAGLPDRLGLSGHLTIVEAAIWIDGGSVTVTVRDENGAAADAGRTSPLRERHAGQLYFRKANARVDTHVVKGSADEQALLHTLGGACMNTFGTADPSALLSMRGSEQAMAWLFLGVERRNRIPPSTTAAFASPPSAALAPESFVTISGVRQPGTILWKPGLTVTKAVFACGGPGWSVPDRSFIIRGAERIRFSLKDILNEGKPDVQLQPGDMVDVSPVLIRTN